mmetsp:Transcript_1881/g.4348  ORF Transcript_1881/g.4348 Transcript_1881/m.4348 type:complete len:291 (-) Transcript_1881:195-1067(-)
MCIATPKIQATTPQRLVLQLAVCVFMEAFCFGAVYLGLWLLGVDYVFSPQGSNPYLSTTIFDTTWWTWLTDYAVAAMCAFMAWRLATCSGDWGVKWPGMALMLAYSIPTLLGGMVHQAAGHWGVEALNSGLLGWGWVFTSAMVGLQGGVMLFIARGYLVNQTRLRFPLLVLSNEACWAHTVLVVLGVLAGVFRCTRPAADIFLLGVTQAWPVMYVMAALASGTTACSFTSAWCAGSFALLSPTILIYPLLVDAGFVVGHINCFLHAVIFVAWFGQGLGVLRVAETPVKQE